MTLGFPAPAQERYAKGIAEHNVSSALLLEWREDVHSRDAKLKDALGVTDTHHCRRLWSAFDLLAALFCWDVLGAGQEISCDRLLAMLKAMRGAFLRKFGTMHRAFNSIDKDKSGSISRQEFQGAIGALQTEIARDVVRVIVELADADGSGEIDFVEFKKLWANLDLPATRVRLEKLLHKLSGQAEGASTEAVDAEAGDAAVGWKPVGSRDLWIAFVAESSLLSKEEGLYYWGDRIVEMQDPGHGQVLLVDVKTDEIVYWNKLHTVSKQDLDDWRQQQAKVMQEDLLKAHGEAIKAVEDALKQGEMTRAQEVQHRADARNRARTSTSSRRPAVAGKASKTSKAAEAASPAQGQRGEGTAAGKSGASKDVAGRGGEADAVGSTLAVMQAGEAPAAAVRAQAVLDKGGALKRVVTESVLAGVRSKVEWIPTVDRRLKAEAEVAAAELQNATFERVARLLFFLVDSVSHSLVPSLARSLSASLARAFSLSPSRLPFLPGTFPLSLTT